MRAPASPAMPSRTYLAACAWCRLTERVKLPYFLPVPRMGCASAKRSI